MKLAFVILAAIFSGQAAADIYRCDVNGRTIYQGWPCHVGTGARITPRVHAPTKAEADAARAREAAAIARVKQIEAREHSTGLAEQREADRAAEIQHNQDMAHRARCERMADDIYRAERDVERYTVNTGSRNRIDAMRARYSVECR